MEAKLLFIDYLKEYRIKRLRNWEKMGHKIKGAYFGNFKLFRCFLSSYTHQIHATQYKAERNPEIQALRTMGCCNYIDMIVVD